jgi:branched-chain amino acid transport system substrate-binding protein
MESTIWFTDGFVVITGEIGAGKTTLIETFLRELQTDVLVAQINQTQLSPTAFLQTVLVQFGFTNSHPDFTKGGDFMWSTSVSQADEQPLLARYAVSHLGLKKLAILHLNTDWGRTSRDHFANAAKEFGAEVVISEGYIPDERDFRSTLVRARDANPDGLILISYYSDGALIARQARQAGLKQTICAASSVYSPKFLELGGEAVEDVHLGTRYFPDDPRPEVQKFVSGFKAKYNGQEPDAFNAYAYDAMNMAAAVIRIGGPDRKAIKDAFPDADVTMTALADGVR